MIVRHSILKSTVPCVITALFFTVGVGFGQSTAGPTFEVATVKPSALDVQKLAMQMQSGQMPAIGARVDRARAQYTFMTIKDLIATAYNLKPFQITGPDWINDMSQRFDIVAKMPDGSTVDQAPQMLQALLAENFKLAVHRENKERPIYALVVGKGGPKLKESPPDEEAPARDEAGGGIAIRAGDTQLRMSRTGNGMVVAGGPTGTTKVSMGEGGAMRLEMSKMPMAGLAEMLTRFVDRPVLDLTELKGNYQVALELSMDDLRNVARAAGMVGPDLRGAAAGEPGKPADAASDPSASSVFQTVQQLGLRLEARKAPVEVIVVDRLEKNPTDN